MSGRQFPSWYRRGIAPSRKRCAATAAAQTGWLGLTKCFRMRSLEIVPFWTTINASPYRARASRPAAPLKEASRLLLDVASTPPMPGGEWRAAQFIHTFIDRACRMLLLPFQFVCDAVGIVDLAQRFDNRRTLNRHCAVRVLDVHEVACQTLDVSIENDADEFAVPVDNGRP